MKTLLFKYTVYGRINRTRGEKSLSINIKQKQLLIIKNSPVEEMRISFINYGSNKEGVNKFSIVGKKYYYSLLCTKQ